MHRLRGLPLPTLVAFLVLLGAAPAATAAVASVSDGVLTYGGAGNELDQGVFLREDGPGLVRVEDDQVVAGAGCVTLTAREVRCTEVTRVVVDSGAGRDSVLPIDTFTLSMTITDSGAATCAATGVCQNFRGGSADDTITDDSVPSDPQSVSQIAARDGNDTIGGSNLRRLFLFGEGGNDLMRAGPGGGRTFVGGPGFDRADYTAATTDMGVTIGSGANDGPSGSDDVQADVEAVSGGSGGDALTGDGGPNVLAGYDGADTLRGLEGNDFMGGGIPVGETPATEDRDVMRGGGGSDTVTYSYLPTPSNIGIFVFAQNSPGMDGTARMIDRTTGAEPAAQLDVLGGDIERFNGSQNGDDLRGGGASSGLTLVGFGGADQLFGGSGADFLDGGQDIEGNTLECRGGLDTYRVTGSGTPSTRDAECENGI